MAKKRSIVLVVAFVIGFSLLFSNYTYAEEKGLVGHWKFDEGKGDIAKDSSGKGNHGKIHGGAKWVKNGLEFDGIDDYVDCGNDSSLNITDAMTIEAWVRTEERKESNPIVCKELEWNQPGYQLFLNRGYMRAILKDSEGDSVSQGVGSKSNDGMWHHLAVVRTSSQLENFVDGVSCGKANASSVGDCTNSRHLFIGSRHDWNTKHPFNGKIGEVRIYNRALSGDEIKEHYKAKIDGYLDAINAEYKDDLNKLIGSGDYTYAEEKGLVGCWKFNEGKGKIAIDSSGKGNHGKIHGGARWVKNGLEFDGIDDRVDCGNDSSLNIADAVTVEAWVKPKAVPKQQEGLACKTDHSYGFTHCIDGKVWIYIKNGNHGVQTPLPNGVWTYITQTCDGTTHRVYLNGVQVLTGRSPGDFASAANFIIGKTTGYFNGIIDEVAIYNRVLSAKEIKEHYEMKAKEYLNEIDARYRDDINRFEKRLESISATSPIQRYWKKKLKERLNKLIIQSLSGQKDIASDFLRFNKVLTSFEGNKIKSNRCLVYAVRPVTNERILPKTAYPSGEISDTLSIVACPGEYEPASFVLHAEEDIKSLRLEITDLRANNNKIIPSSNIDIRVVKCWYQDRGSSYQGQKTPVWTYNPISRCGIKVLVPELLLKDDSLVKVDHKNRHNYLKLVYHKGTSCEIEHYVCVSREEFSPRFNKYSTYKDFPVRDSQTLLPVNINKKSNKQFWVTAHVPENVSSGTYKGQIKLVSKKGPIGTLFIKLKVLPFKLSEPYYISSIDTYETNEQFYKDKTMEQFKKEMENLYAHGVTNPTIPMRLAIDLSDVLRIRNEAGMKNKAIFHSMRTGSETKPEALEILKNKVKKVIKTAKSYGIEEVYILGRDEAHEEALAAQRPVWEAVHEVGGKIWAGGWKASNFEVMGDIQDLYDYGAYPSKKEAERWHSKGQKICCYANPQSGAEVPDTYRRNYGLLLWQNDYDGAMTSGYFDHGGLDTVWNDWSGFIYKNHNMVYPTIDGMIDTLQWEGYREGVDDVRYLTTLLKAIKKAETSGSSKIKKAALEAKSYLKGLKAKDINLVNKDMDIVRAEMINHILKLQEK